MTIDRGTTLESFATTGDWTLSGTAGYPALAVETTYVREGANNVRAGTAVSGWARMLRTVAWDLSAMTNIAFRFYCPTDSAELLNSVELQFCESTGVTVYYKYVINPIPGWNDVSIDKAAFTAVGGASNWGAIIRFSIELGNSAGKAGWFVPDVLTKEYQGLDGRGTIVVTADDNSDTVYDLMYPLMVARDIRWTQYCPTNEIGGAGLCSLAELHVLYADGVDISSHGHTHTNFTTLDAGQVAGQVVNTSNYLKTNGFFDSAPFIAYPYGGVSVSIATEASRRFASGRTITAFVNSAHRQPDGLAEMYMPAYDSYGKTPAELLAVADRVIVTKGVLSFYFHKFTAGAPGALEYNTTDFATFADGLVTRIQAGTLWVPTVSEYMRACERAFSLDPAWKRKKLYPRTYSHRF